MPSHNNYLEILNGTADIIVLIDLKGKIIFANEAYCHAFGCTPIEAAGQQLVADIIGNYESEQIIIDQFTNSSDKFVVREYKVVTTTGPRCLQFVFTKNENENSMPNIIATGRDITESRWKTNSLQSEYKNIRALIDCAPFAIICLNREKIIVECNRQIETLLLYPREDAMGSHLSRIIHKDFHRMVDNSLKESINSSKSYTTKSQIVRRDGVIVPSRLTMVPRLDENGNFTQTICFIESLANIRQTYASDKSDTMRFREELNNKDIALKELLSQINNQQTEVQKKMQININRLILPMIHQLEDSLTDENHQRILTLKNALLDITTPFTNSLENDYDDLSPRETQICNLISDGLSSKQIASSLAVSVHTVHNQRRSIRRKLGIAEQNTNMSSHLKNLKKQSRLPIINQ